MAAEILITGVRGFIGSAVTRRLASDGRAGDVLGVSRQASGEEGMVEQAALLQGRVDLTGCACVLHLAGRAHVMGEADGDALPEYRAANVEDTKALARVAAEAGVKRFVYLSSIKVNGEYTQPGCPFQPDDTPAPETAYGQSKMEAEAAIRAIGRETGMEIVIVRSVLVYGPGVKGNFRSLLNLVRRGVPLPLASVDNRRSLVALDNIADLLVTCLDHPDAANQTFLVSDGFDLSTPGLLRRLSAAQGSRPRLFPFPVTALKWIGALIRRKGVVERLTGSLQIDMAKTRHVLDWAPPVSVDEQVSAAVRSIDGERAQS